MATWSTGDPTIASVNSIGLVTTHRTGEVAIRAAYRGTTGWAAVWAYPGMGLRGTYRTLIGTVISTEGGGLAGVDIQILDGPNARRVTTFPNGGFYIEGLQDGGFTIRFSKPGYQTVEVVWWVPGGRERGMVMRPLPK